MKPTPLDRFSTPTLREEVKTCWANFAARKHFLTLGLHLMAVYDRKAYRDWSHRGFYAYCEHELNFPVHQANAYIAAVRRLLDLDCTPEDFRTLEARCTLKRVLVASRIALVREEVFALAYLPDDEMRVAARALLSKRRTTLGPFPITAKEKEIFTVAKDALMPSPRAPGKADFLRMAIVASCSRPSLAEQQRIIARCEKHSLAPPVFT